MLKRLAKSFPQPAKPLAVYGTKKITIMIAAMNVRIFFPSPYLSEKNAGTVIEPVASVYCLILFAVISQFRYVPAASPMMVQPASAIPDR